MSRSEIIQLNRTTYGVSIGCSRFVGHSGVLAAGVAADGILAAWNLSTDCFIERIRVNFTTITAFATPVTAGRAIALTRLTTMPAAGSSDTFLVDKHNGTSVVTGGMVIANNAALGGAAVSGDPFWLIPLTNAGTAGANVEAVLNFGLEAANLRFPEGVLGLIAFNTFDAGGTFQLVAEIDFETEP